MPVPTLAGSRCSSGLTGMMPEPGRGGEGPALGAAGVLGATLLPAGRQASCRVGSADGRAGGAVCGASPLASLMRRDSNRDQKTVRSQPAGDGDGTSQQRARNMTPHGPWPVGSGRRHSAGGRAARTPNCASGGQPVLLGAEGDSPFSCPFRLPQPPRASWFMAPCPPRSCAFITAGPATVTLWPPSYEDPVLTPGAPGIRARLPPQSP